MELGQKIIHVIDLSDFTSFFGLDFLTFPGPPQCTTCRSFDTNPSLVMCDPVLVLQVQS